MNAIMIVCYFSGNVNEIKISIGARPPAGITIFVWVCALLQRALAELTTTSGDSNASPRGGLAIGAPVEARDARTSRTLGNASFGGFAFAN